MGERPRLAAVASPPEESRGAWQRPAAAATPLEGQRESNRASSLCAVAEGARRSAIVPPWQSSSPTSSRRGISGKVLRKPLLYALLGRCDGSAALQRWSRPLLRVVALGASSQRSGGGSSYLTAHCFYNVCWNHLLCGQWRAPRHAEDGVLFIRCPRQASCLSMASAMYFPLPATTLQKSEYGFYMDTIGLHT